MFEYDGDYYTEDYEVPVLVVRSKKQQLPRPNYRDNRYKKLRTIYGKASEKLLYDYTDRLWERNHKKSQAATDHANNDTVHTIRSVRWYEAYLSHYTGTSVTIEHVQASYHLATGNPIYLLGYRKKNNNE